MDFVYDIYLEAPLRRRKLDILPEAPYLLDAPVGSAVYLEYVEA